MNLDHARAIVADAAAHPVTAVRLAATRLLRSFAGDLNDFNAALDLLRLMPPPEREEAAP